MYGTDILPNAKVIIILQYTNVSNQHSVYFKFIELYANYQYISIFLNCSSLPKANRLDKTAN